MDDSVWRNLDTQHRRLAEAEQTLAALLAGETPPVSPNGANVPGRDETYDELTESNDTLRIEKAWQEIDLDDAPGAEQRAQFEQWRQRQRLPWSPSDFAAVGLAGLLGTAATVYDTAIDAKVRERLLSLKDTELFGGFEDAGRRLAIDYTGPGFGGPAHRVRSAGHDLARPLEALKQIREGKFRGIEWADGPRYVVERDHGQPVDTLPEAITLWAQHLAADFVTKTSLPLPGWTLLYELPWRDARKFAHNVYAGTAWGEGWNSRNGLLTPSLPVISTEIIIRSHVHARAWNRAGTHGLDHGHRALQAELLLASHALAGAAALAKATATMFAGPGGALALGAPNLLALRHLNLPTLVAIGFQAAKVISARGERDAMAAASWDDLLDGLHTPWQFPEATAIEEAVVPSAS